MPTFSIDPQKLEALLNYCLNFAKQMIQNHGEFFPFGAVIVENGQITAVGGYTGEEQPPAAEVYTLLEQSMRAEFAKKKILAAAIAANVTIPAQFHPPFPDGIRVQLECAGFSRFFYLPFRISGKSVDYSDFITADVPPTICIGE